jgi:U32 family peptidase
MDPLPPRVSLIAPAATLAMGMLSMECGADELYAGLLNWSLRSPCFEMNMRHLEDLNATTLKLGKKLRVALNTYPWEHDIATFDEGIRCLYGVGVRSFIIADIASIHAIRRQYPEVFIQASVGADVQSIADVLALARAGADSVTLKRPSAAFVRQVKAESSAKVEVFAHGYLNYTFRARCYMSSYLKHAYDPADPDRNHASGSFNREGFCNRACKCQWTLTNCHPLAHEVTMNSYPFVAIDELVDLMQAGIDGLKIQGRENSVELVRQAVSLYREIVDGFLTEPQSYCISPDSKERAHEIDRWRHQEMKSRSGVMIREMLGVEPTAPVSVWKRK